MQDQNQSRVSEFFLQGILDNPKMQIPFFILFLLIYFFTVTGNALIIIVICMDHKLYKPMYYFLCNLSVLDFSLASVIQPKLLAMFLMENHTISFAGCISQLYFFLCFTSTEIVFLSAMSYDRYVAICKPLKYPLLVNNTFCVLMTTTCWVTGFLEPLSHAIVIGQLPFYKSQINHFYCDYSALLKNSSIDTYSIEVMTYVAGTMVAIPAFSLVLSSYIYIITTILKIHSSEGRQKAFSTCASHLTVVILFYTTVFITHLRPSASYSSDQSKLLSLFYTTFIPSVNPFIYTLRNKDVQQSFQKRIRK